MKTVTIDHGSAIPAYRQIASAFRNWVARGDVSPGETLPSVRRLGQQLGVNLNTVAKAYRLLADEGLVELRQGAPARFTGSPAPAGALSLAPEATRTLHGVFDAWVLAGADRKQVEDLLDRVVNEYFGAYAGKEPST